MNEWMHVMNIQKKEVMHWTYMKETELGFGADACKFKLCLNVIQKNNK